LLVACGLGNPGVRFTGTRHNIGKETVVGLAEQRGLRLKPARGRYHVARDPQRGLRLVVPTTYMNDSGRSARQVLEELHAGPGDLLAVCDDFNLPLGTLRIRKRGSDGGHNGLASMIYQLETEDFPRLRIGVGPVPEGIDPADFVLAPFESEEREAAGRLSEIAGDAVLAIVAEGLDDAMNRFNRMHEGPWRSE
jgi:PTH1 family peptidyl-tRNA hydrolase